MHETNVFWLSVFTFWFMISCNKQADNFFDTEIEYQALEVVQETMFDNIYMPRKMRIVDDHLLVADYTNNPPFHILHLQDDHTLRYAYGAGEEGRGPGEFQLIEDFLVSDSLIYIYDGGQLRLTVFDYSLQPTGEDDIPLRIEGRPITMHAISDEKFLAVGIFHRDRFQVFNRNGDIIGQYGEQIALHEDFSSRHNAISWYSFGAISPNKNFIYLFAMAADFIEKYDIESGELIKQIKGSQFPYPRKRLVETNGQLWPEDDGGIYAYLWAGADDHYIYALYTGRLESEFEDRNELGATKIHKFDWDLNLVGAYELDHKTYMISADGKGGIYSLNVLDEGIQFRYYRIWQDTP